MDKDTVFYMVAGKRIGLARLHHAKYVSPAKGEHAAAVGARLSRSSRLSLDTAVPGAHLVVRGDRAKLEEVRSYRDVRSTRSAFRDPDGLELVLTDEVLVSFAPDVPVARRRRLCDTYSCVPIEEDGDTWRLKTMDPGDDAPLLIANAFDGEADVAYAEPNALQAAHFLAVPLPTDAFFKHQWHLRNTGQGAAKAGADVKARGAWDITQGDRSVRVVVHDSGVDIDHPDLKANMAAGWDFDNDDPDASNDTGPHGTACAGVIAAARNNKGVVGIAPKCKITPLRAAGSLTWQQWAQTFRWAASHGEVISCSWKISPNATLTAAIREAATQGRGGKGIPVLVATGNDFATTIAYPASLADTIAVGASTDQDVRSGYSNYGTGIDFVAPSSGGVRRIETTDVVGSTGYSAGDYCKAANATGFGGTSSATPLAAGVAALMLSVNPNLPATDVRRMMRATCDKIDGPNARHNARGWSTRYGYGRVNAAEAVKRAKAAASPSPAPRPRPRPRPRGKGGGKG